MVNARLFLLAPNIDVERSVRSFQLDLTILGMNFRVGKVEVVVDVDDVENAPCK